ncbi:uncharacterized protein MKK02DRAFT_28536 [Dioszegia hungarica]|uniref:Uncharacterized protein n=1 Tax=Dioszegia hungarica TaxID=4972 RepID=A0AA38LUE6_9TREE|nr:uncharacterized protein MKK02DRAFT_28536 [Dioszegia hungarica]KAI9633766.1 hypothetical protein MKK02DRAFT_28536 [Dioszegia hungarica]
MTHAPLQPSSTKTTCSASASQPTLDALDALDTQLDATLKDIETWRRVRTPLECCALADEVASKARNLDGVFDSVIVVSDDLKTAFENAAALAPHFYARPKASTRLGGTDPNATSFPTTVPMTGSGPSLSLEEQVVAGLKGMWATVFLASVQTKAAKTTLEAEDDSADDIKSRLPQVMRVQKRKVAETFQELLTAVGANCDAETAME